jgi:carboxypeptidase D
MKSVLLTFSQLFDASHMVGVDVPNVANDMIMRFMDVDLSLLPGKAASSPGRIGSLSKVVVAIGGAAGMPLLKGGSFEGEFLLYSKVGMR